MHSVSILLAEDNQVVSDAVRDALAAQGWRVETCRDGAQALRLIEGDLHFDALLLDNDLPAVDGLELTRRARSLTHRRLIPVVIFSASEARLAAKRAGADAVLGKPEDVTRIVETLEWLVADAGPPGGREPRRVGVPPAPQTNGTHCVTAGTENGYQTRGLEVLPLRQGAGGTAADPWRGFSLKEEARLLEARFIRLALEEAGGSVTRAARLLGLNHQTLSVLLNRRHRDLLPLRRPAVPRRHSIIRPSEGQTPPGGRKTKPGGAARHPARRRGRGDRPGDARADGGRGAGRGRVPPGRGGAREAGGSDRDDQSLFGGEPPGAGGF